MNGQTVNTDEPQRHAASINTATVADEYTPASPDKGCVVCGADLEALPVERSPEPDTRRGRLQTIIASVGHRQQTRHLNRDRARANVHGFAEINGFRRPCSRSDLSLGWLAPVGGSARDVAFERSWESVRALMASMIDVRFDQTHADVANTPAPATPARMEAADERGEAVRIGRIIAGVTAAGGVAIFGSVNAFEDQTKRDESGHITSTGGVGAFVVQVGDCIQLPDDARLVVSVEGVPCDAPHDAEAYAKLNLPDATTYDTNKVQSQALDGCLARWRSAIGTDFSTDRDLDVVTFQPTALTWKMGDREVVCFVTSIDGSPLRGSKRHGN